MVRVLERLETYTPLGIRLWDPVTDQPIRDALTVSASPEARPQARVQAMRSYGGVYAFLHLPGLRGLEYGYEPAAPASPALQREYVVQVGDLRRRYLPVAFRVGLPLPYRGVHLSGGAAPLASPSSPVEAAPRGLHLYSAPTRPVPPSAAALRGELRRAADGAPAAHAVVSVETDTGETWHGLSDAQGRFVVILPYPTLTHGFGGSPPGLGHLPLFEQTWPLLLSVRYEPQAQIALAGAEVPDYLSVLQQAQAEIYAQAPSAGGLPVASIPVELRFDRHPTVRTEGLSQLLVDPSTASP